MNKLFALIAITLATASCMQLEVKPGRVIGDTVDAGKEAYQSIQRSRRGEEERGFSHKTSYDSAISNAANIAGCKEELMEVVSVSDLVVSQVISESSEVLVKDGDKTIYCAMRAVVRPKA
ncbi:hypothetical protein [Microbulbifer variabilis]|uniref:Lipoprotein n=1 Tax=Microbulbifer variabilis TaxID=266805 RepID=A0ABY4V9E1_9GAMM|nr:hypothetical protein [Microbulbifer variabilis]USD20864.1 hypothetical protein MJO52_17645 [Microbulbifer variabilis]